MRKTRRNGELIRQFFGLIMGLGGVVMLIHTIPITVWYIIFLGLILVLLFLIFMAR